MSVRAFRVLAIIAAFSTSWFFLPTLSAVAQEKGGAAKKGTKAAGASTQEEGEESHAETRDKGMSKATKKTGEEETEGTEKAPDAKAGKGAAKNGKGQAKKSGNGGDTDTYCVVQIGNDELKVLKTSELSSFKQKMDETYKADLKKYDEARAAARKAKKKFEDKKPAKKAIKVLAPSLKSQGAATEFRDRQQKKIDAAKAKAKAKTKGVAE